MTSSASRSPSPPAKLQPANVDPPNVNVSGPLRRLLPASPSSSGSPASPAAPSGPAESQEDSKDSKYSSPWPHPRAPPAASGPSSGTGSGTGSVRGSGPSSSSSALPLPVVPARRKRVQSTTAACGACRKRKSRCDGERPTCSICGDRGTVCEYDTNKTETHTQALKRKYNELQSQQSTFEQVYGVLQLRPEQEANEVYRRIRRGDDADSILRHVKHGDLLVQLSLVPEARFRYEFPYLSDMPPFLRSSENPYLGSEVYQYSLRGSPGSSDQPGHQLGHQQQFLPGPRNAAASAGGSLDGTEAAQRDPYLKPYSSATVAHPWLDSVRPSKWTTVSSDDNLMKKILHDFFLFEYDWFSFVHMDYFLEDMATMKRRFCSPVLVNALLCIGCFCHRGLQNRAEFWNPRNLGYQFLAEAKRLLELELEVERPFRNPDDPSWERRDTEWEQTRLTTIQTALILNIIHNLNGSDKIGWRYTLKAIELADEIQLFGPPPKRYGREMLCVRAYTAWELFCWQSIESFHYEQPPPAREPPKIPLPNPTEQPQWYGELWVIYPLSQSLCPTHHGHLLKAKAEFWTIVNDVALTAFSHRHSAYKLTVGEIFQFCERLKAWLRNLPEPLTPRKIVLPHQLKLHMYYNQILMDLVTPILDYTGEPGSSLAFMPRGIYQEAVTYFETCMRLYYLRHGFEAPDSFLLHFLGLLNHINMNAIETSMGSSYLEHRRSTLLLLTKGMHYQSRIHYTARFILRLQLRLMRPEDLELLKQFVEIEADQLIFGPMEQAVHTNWSMYEVGLEAKTEQRRQGKSLATTLASLSLEPAASTQDA